MMKLWLLREWVSGRISNRRAAFAEEESCSRLVNSALYLRVVPRNPSD